MTQIKKIGILTTIIVTPAIFNFAFINPPTTAELNEITTYKNYDFIETTPIASETDMSIFKLWEDDLTLSNEAAFCLIGNDMNTENKIKQLCENKTQLNLLIQSSYGTVTRKKFASLLETHIMATFDLAIALQNKNKNIIVKSTKNWNDNNELISALIEKSETTNRLSNIDVKMNDHSNQIIVGKNNIEKVNVQQALFIPIFSIGDSISEITTLDTLNKQKNTDTLVNRFENHKFKIVVKKIATI